MEVSESTVTWLKVVLTAASRAVWAASAVSGASVDSTQSIVAMLGWIMPEPLTKPPTCTVTGAPSAPVGTVPSTETSLETVSVVMTAHAAAWAASGVLASAETAIGTPVSYGASGSGTPITPVDATSTCSGSHPRTEATISVEASAVLTPSSPVAALALPELRTIAWATPAAARGRETCTGAAQKRLVVNVAAQVHGASATTRARSERAGSLRNPACTPAARIPAAAQMPPVQGAKPNSSMPSATGGTGMGAMVPGFI